MFVTSVVVELLHPPGDELGLDAARGRPAEGREKGGDRHAQVGQGAVDRLLDVRLAGGVADEEPGQRADLHGPPLPAGRLEPGVLAVDFEVLVGRLRPGVGEVRLPLPRMEGGRVAALVRVPGMGDGFRDLAGVGRVDLVDAGEVAVEDDPPRELESRRIADAARRQVAVAQVVRDPAADRGPVLVIRRHREKVGDVDLVDDPHGVVDELADEGQALGVEGHGVLGPDRGVGAHRRGSGDGGSCRRRWRGP